MNLITAYCFLVGMSLIVPRQDHDAPTLLYNKTKTHAEVEYFCLSLWPSIPCSSTALIVCNSLIYASMQEPNKTLYVLLSGCQIYGTIGGLTGFISINTLTAMAVDRYQVFNLNNIFIQKVSKGSHSFIIGCIWVYSILWALVPVFGWGKYVLNGGRNSCCFDYLSHDTMNLAFVICLFTFCFTIQFLVIVYCYASMLVFICRHERAFLTSDLILKADKATRKKIKLELRVTRLVFIIVAAFCLAWMPFAIVSLIGAFGDTSLVTPIASIIPGLLAKISTAINPMLYAISHPKFQEKLREEFPHCPMTKMFRRKKSTQLSNIYHATVCNKSGQMMTSLRS